MVDMMAIPYLSGGYDRITKYKASLRSKNAFRGGIGAILMGSVLNLD